MDKYISSLANPTIKDVAKLLTKSSYRRQESKMVVDGLREISLALEFSYKPLFFLVEEGFDLDILSNFSDLIIRVSHDVFQKVSYKESPDGYIGVFEYKKKGLDEIKLSKNPLVIILEAVEKPGNLGAVLRTAYAAGVDVVICNDLAVDIYNPNTIRSSTGRVFTRQIALASVEDTISWLKKNKINYYITSIKAKDSYCDKDYSKPSAFVLGSEAWGLSKKWLESGSSDIVIPMKENIDSLNVSVSAGIVIFEALRQRKFKF